MPAVIFTTGIGTHRCDDPVNANKSACISQQLGRRRAQAERAACPHPTFLTRDAAMRDACGIDPSTVPGAAALPLQCPSTDCSLQLLGLLDDCTASIGRAAADESAFYTALESSEFYASCAQLDQSAATFATVKVEFRAPSRLVADRLIVEHEKLAAEMATKFTQGCDSPTDNSCGRRALQQSADEIDALRESLDAANRQLQAVTAERDMLRDTVSEQQDALATCNTRTFSGAPQPTPAPRRR
jgi:hypothetical protein